MLLVFISLYFIVVGCFVSWFSKQGDIGGTEVFASLIWPIFTLLLIGVMIGEGIKWVLKQI
jgi:hypothetical protein